MAYDAQTLHKTTLDGFSYAQTLVDAANGFEGVSVTVPAAKPGTMTAANQITFAPGHGFSGGGITIDVFWAGGARRQCTAVLAGNVATVTVGVGDALPAVGTPVAAMDPIIVPVVITGNSAKAICAYGAAPGYVAFLEVAALVMADDEPDPRAGEVLVARIRNAGDGVCWTASSGLANPFAGKTILSLAFSHGSTSPRAMRAGVALQ